MYNLFRQTVVGAAEAIEQEFSDNDSDYIHAVPGTPSSTADEIHSPVIQGESARTPTADEMRMHQLFFGKYPIYKVPITLAKTPRSSLNARYCYTLISGFSNNPDYPRMFGEFDPHFSVAANHHAFTNEDDYVIDSYTKLPLHDAVGHLVHKFRVVIDLNGNFILALNGRGSASIPFHHQMPLPASAAFPFFDYDKDIKGLNSVLFAGELGLGSDGLIYYVSNRSGHYMPDSACFNIMWDFLSKRPDRLAPVIKCHDYSTDAITTMFHEMITYRSKAINPEVNGFFDVNHTEVVNSVSRVEPIEDYNYFSPM